MFLTRQGTMCSSILLCVCTWRDTASGKPLCIIYRPPSRLFLPTWALCLAGARIYLNFIRISLEHSRLLGTMRLSRLYIAATHGLKAE